MKIIADNALLFLTYKSLCITQLNVICCGIIQFFIQYFPSTYNIWTSGTPVLYLHVGIFLLYTLCNSCFNNNMTHQHDCDAPICFTRWLCYFLMPLFLFLPLCLLHSVALLHVWFKHALFSFFFILVTPSWPHPLPNLRSCWLTLWRQL